MTVKSQYICNLGFEYTEESDILECTDPSVTLVAGQCLKSLYVFLLLFSYKAKLILSLLIVLFLFFWTESCSQNYF